MCISSHVSLIRPDGELDVGFLCLDFQSTTRVVVSGAFTVRSTVVLSGQSRLHGQNFCQARGEDGRRALRTASLPAPAGVLPDLPRELLRWRNAGSLRAVAGL